LLFSTAAPLQDAVLVQKGALLLRRVFLLRKVLVLVHVVKVLILVAVMEGLLLLAVSHHEAVLKLPEALLLEIQTVMYVMLFLVLKIKQKVNFDIKRYFLTFVDYSILFTFFRNKLFFMKYSRDTTVPVAVLIILDDFVNVNGLIKVIEGFLI